MKKVRHLRQERRVKKLFPVYYNNWWAKKINTYFDNILTNVPGFKIVIAYPPTIVGDTDNELAIRGGDK